jgi:hypothetical protein
MASKSLGTLTLDLVAKTGGFVAGMSKADRESAKWRKSVERNAKAAGKAIGLAAVASGAALTALVSIQIKQADQSRKTAQSIGLSTEAYTALTFAASQSGVEQAALTASLGKLNRSMLEAATGTEQYEQAFAALGVSVIGASGDLRNGEDVLKDIAERFKDLPDGAEKSAIAMDLLGRSGTKLIPLLNSGASGIDALTKQAETLGLVISEKTAMEAELFNDSLAVMGALSTGLGRRVAADLLPNLSVLADDFARSASEGQGLAEVSEKISNGLRRVSASVVGTVASFDLLGKSIGGFAATIAPIFDGVGSSLFTSTPVGALSKIAENIYSGTGEVKAAFNVATADLDATAQKYASLINTILNPDIDAGESTSVVKNLAGLLKGLRTDTAATKTEAEKMTDAINKQIKELQLQAEVVGMTSDAVKLYKLETEGATTSQLDAARAALLTVSAYEAQTEAAKKAAEEQANINQQVTSIVDGLATEEELIRQSYERRKQIILDNTLVTGEAQQQLLTRLTDQTNEKLDELNMGYWEKYLSALEENFADMDTLTADMLENVTGKFGDAFEAMVFDAESLEDAVYKLADGMLRSVVNALGQMAGQWIAYQAVQLATGQSSQAAVTASSVASGTAIAASYAPAAAMASLASFGANAAPAMAGITATSALAKGMSLVGMAHEGMDSIPKTGTWLLEKGERVTTADTSAKLDKTLSSVQQGIGSGGMGGNVRIVNAWDTSMIGDYMGSSAGEEVIMNAVRRNQRTIRSIAR